MKERNSIGYSFEDRVFYLINNLFLGLIFIVTAYPIIYIIASSFSSSEAVSTGKVILWPVEPSIKGYEAVFKNPAIISGYVNSIIYTIVGTIINIVMTVLAAYALSRKELPGNQFISFLFAFTMWFSGGMIPNYLLIKELGFIDTRWALWLPGAIGVYNMIITRTFFANTIPKELFESACIDGCGYTGYLFRILLPLSGPILAVITLFYAVGHWNAYFNAFLYINSRELYPLQIVLRDILIQNTIDTTMVLDQDMQKSDLGLADLLKYSLIMVACVPVWCMYPFVQKFFVKGIMLGSVKI